MTGRMKHSGRKANSRHRAAPSPGHNRKTVILIAAVALGLLVGATGFRMLLTSQHHETVGGPYALSDGHGHAVTQADFRGRYTILYFGYTHCIDVCPLTLATVSAALDRLGTRGHDVTPIFISVDPERDTPPVVQAYVTRFSPRIVGLTGTADQLRPVLAAFHVTVHQRDGKARDYLVDHTSLLYVMDGRNHLVSMIPVDASVDQMANDLSRVLHDV